jgi:hypothetical protein
MSGIDPPRLAGLGTPPEEGTFRKNIRSIRVKSNSHVPHS